MTWPILLLVLLALACATAGGVLVRDSRARRSEQAILLLLQTFGPAVERVQDDPRQLLVWEPLARAARRLFPAAFRQIDAALGGSFPFTGAHIQAAHARWTADWLAWERTHDFEYKLKAAEVERTLEREGIASSPEGRARLASVEREKLERYQQRYEEYVRVSKGLAGLGAGELP